MWWMLMDDEQYYKMYNALKFYGHAQHIYLIDCKRTVDHMFNGDYHEVIKLQRKYLSK